MINALPRAAFATRTIGLIMCGSLALNYSLRAGEPDTKAVPTTTTEPEPEYKNWIELGIGGLIINGDAAQFKQEHRMSGDIYGGITDAHIEKQIGEDVQLTLDGHAIFDNNDYNVQLTLSKAKLGYLKAGFDEFRSWYDGNGGFFPHGGNGHGTWFPPTFPEMHIDRGEAWIELGLEIPDWPVIVLHYSHIFRDGMKDSTVWGDTTLTNLVVNNPRKIAPAFRDIDERRDIFALEATKTFGNTDVNIGMHYEHDDLDNSLNLERGAGQLPPRVAAPGAQRFITQKENNTTDIYEGHATTETRFSETLWFTGAYSFNTLGNDLAGSRIVGPNYNSMFGNFPQLQSNDHAIIDLAGTSQVNEHVFNANLFWMPCKDLNALVGFRYTHDETEASSTFLDFNTSGTPLVYTIPVPKSADSLERLNNFSERFELRYTHVENWNFYVEGEWTEEFGDVREHEFGGAIQSGVLVRADQGAMTKDNYLLGQKYTAGATWYPLTYLNLAAQYYYKIADYDNDFHTELNTPTDTNPSTPGGERNQRLLGQDWETQDVNIRITFRPKVPAKLGTISLVSRYDFMQTAVSGKWGISPAGPPPNPAPTPPGSFNTTGVIFNEERSGTITTHVFSEALNWNPLPRLYFQTTFSYTLSETDTPVGKTNLISTGTTLYPSSSVPNFRNDFWTISSEVGFIVDDKTDIHADYSFYRAPDYLNHARTGMPYGAGQTESSLSATASRQITKNMRLLFRYCYFTYEDQTFGNHNNYEAHSFYSGLQVRF